MARQMNMRADKFNEKWLMLILTAAWLVSLFLFLGRSPFLNEEPRRSIIAQEMDMQDNLWVPTEIGEFYYKKPPVFNWTIVLTASILGEYNELAGRIPSAVSFILLVVVLFLFLKKYTTREHAWIATALFAVSGDIYFGFCMYGEIDLFYSFITLTSFFLLYHFEQKKKYLPLFLSLYGLGAVGLLTKGFPSPVFIAVTVLAFFIWRKDWKQWFCWQHFAGMALFVLISGAYLWVYSFYNNPLNYFDDLWEQSSHRTVAGMGVSSLFVHLFRFPAEVLKGILPAGILILLFLFRSSRAEIRKNDAVAFLFVIFLANILVYWVSPGTKMRYIFMLYPLLIAVLVWMYLSFRRSALWVLTAERVAGWLAACVLLGLGLWIPFTPLTSLAGNTWIIGGVTVAMGVCLAAALWRWPVQSGIWAIAAIIAARIVFDMTVLRIREFEGEHVTAKQTAGKVAEITRGEKLWLRGWTDDQTFNLQWVYYIEQRRGEVLRINKERNCEDFFLEFDYDVDTNKVQVYMDMTSRGIRHLLVKHKCE